MTVKSNTLMAVIKTKPLTMKMVRWFYVQRIKINGKYFAFNEKGQMQDGLQYINADSGFYYFDENGYQKTGRVTKCRV